MRLGNSEAEGPVFRQALDGDRLGIMRLYRQLHPDDPPLDQALEGAAFSRILRSPDLRLFVLVSDGRVVASTYLNVIPNLTRSAAPYAVIENVIVEEALRGTGLGKQIMALTLQAAWEAGCYKAMLLTGSRSPSTHAFYQACGFDPDTKTAYLARPS